MKDVFVQRFVEYCPQLLGRNLGQRNGFPGIRIDSVGNHGDDQALIVSFKTSKNDHHVRSSVNTFNGVVYGKTEQDARS
jgi:hypothetical protein